MSDALTFSQYNRPVKSYDQTLKSAYFRLNFGQFSLIKSLDQYPMLHSVIFWDENLVLGSWLLYIQRQLDLSGWVTKMNYAFCGTPYPVLLLYLPFVYCSLTKNFPSPNSPLSAPSILRHSCFWSLDGFWNPLMKFVSCIKPHRLLRLLEHLCCKQASIFSIHFLRVHKMTE